MIIKKDISMLQNYFEDNSGLRGAFADFVALAENEKDIADFLIEMSQKKIPVTVAGAMTANTGAALAFGGAVLSLEKLNKIGGIKVIDGKNAYICAQAGARLCAIKEKVYGQGWLYPPDPTEKNSSIGGNISTNASGGIGFKFGSTRDYIKSLKIIFTDGSDCFIERGKCFADSNGVLSFRKGGGECKIKLPKYILPAIKNAAAYYNYDGADLIDIFIGSEGTLGVIYEAELFLIPAYKDIIGGFVFFNSKKETLIFTQNLLSQMHSKTSAVYPMSLEYLDGNSLQILRADYPQIPQEAQGALIFEQDIYEEQEREALTDKWATFLEENSIDFEKVWFASNAAQMKNFLEIRADLPRKVNEMVKKNGFPKVYSDFAVPEGKLFEIYDFCEAQFKELNLPYLFFGHIGENHLHANIIAANEADFTRAKEIYSVIIQKVVDLGGTCSAEHGIGKTRHLFLEKMIGKVGFAQASKFKLSLDKSGILGAGNIFPKEYLKQA
ncbi:MAG: FAD-binding oxidoreductase [Elusimicrobiota bacterium]|jgi:D-lactate dehydrogenase (cytochrome)|nr:FAD-binding oxidoreductase [Elusimicrobiota bacterium]